MKKAIESLSSILASYESSEISLHQIYFQTLNFSAMFWNVTVYQSKDKKEEIWLSPMTKAPTPTEMSKGQSDNTNNATKKFD